MNNAFYSNSQNLDLLLRYLKFCPACHVVSRAAKQLDRKVEVYFKICHDKKTKYYQKSQKVSYNQIIKFGQLTEYSVRNIFSQKSCRK